MNRSHIVRILSNKPFKKYCHHLTLPYLTRRFSCALSCASEAGLRDEKKSKSGYHHCTTRSRKTKKDISSTSLSGRLEADPPGKNISIEANRRERTKSLQVSDRESIKGIQINPRGRNKSIHRIGVVVHQRAMNISLSSTVSETGRSDGMHTVSGFKIIHRFNASSHQSFPYTRSDLTPMDTSLDEQFYSHPRFVHHIDQTAVSLLRRYYGSIIRASLSSMDTHDSVPPTTTTSFGATNTNAPNTSSTTTNIADSAAATGPTASTVAITTEEKAEENHKKSLVVLDLCSSWDSLYPESLSQDLHSSGRLVVYGVGMNAAELSANPFLSSDKSDGLDRPREKARWTVHDLNQQPFIPLPALGLKQVSSAISTATSVTQQGETTSSSLSSPRTSRAGDEQEAQGQPTLINLTTLSVSIDYLREPVKVLGSLFDATSNGGSVHVAVSNRCFPTKVIRRWLEVDETERLFMVCEMLWWAGWRDVHVVELSSGKQHTDPLWVACATKRT